MRRILTVLFVLAIVFAPWLQQASIPAQAEPAAPTEVPVVLVPPGNVVSFTLVAPKLFFNNGVPICPSPVFSDIVTVDPPTYPEMIKRKPTYGGDVRTIYYDRVVCDGGKIQSNIVADVSFIYWLTFDGLYRISTNANLGDPPELVNSNLVAPGMLAMADDRVFAFYKNSTTLLTQVGYVTKVGKVWQSLVTQTGVQDLKSDGAWVYYRVGATLYRIKPGTPGVVVVASGVSGYYPEGVRGGCTGAPPVCIYTNYTFIGKGASIYRYNNSTETLGSPVYTSFDSTAEFTQLVTDGTRAFFIERRDVPCSPQPCFSTYSFVLSRISRSGSALADPLYTIGPTMNDGIDNLVTDGAFLYFYPQSDDPAENIGLVRLPNDAAALPVINMKVTGMEVTQTIQNLSNDVFLIKDKRTFVRVYVKSDGAAVWGVTALLDAPDHPAFGSLTPVNTTAATLTVRGSPDRSDIDQSFVFELPWSWTEVGAIKLRANLNPYKLPLEPGYVDNVDTVTVSFVESPSLSVEFLRLGYQIGTQTYTPRLQEDVLQTISWIKRAYPLSGEVGKFHWRIWDLDGGAMLGGMVNTTDPLCKMLYPDPGDDISLCASAFENSVLYYYRQAIIAGDPTLGLDPNAFFYGMIAAKTGSFPRGQAAYDKTSVGPAGIPKEGDWDTDGSYADWYGAHEIGHSLGRAHPIAGADNPGTYAKENCGHSPSDLSYPYFGASAASAPIGPPDKSYEGFDAGDPSLGIPMAVLPSTIWSDLMSYCDYQWISDYTYASMYGYMAAFPSASAIQPASARVSGDFLVVAGVINTNTGKGGFSLVRRAASVAAQPAVTQHAYALRLLNASNARLGTDQAITTTAQDTPGMRDFGHVLTLLPGARRVQLVRIADAQVLATYNISANAPTIGSVALGLAPNPVSGWVTLNWTASDLDGDPLTFDIFYSRDNGVTYQPVITGVTGTSTPIDTDKLGGSGTARLRVIASDGANTAQADSALFAMSSKPPQPFILQPANNTHVRYGQLVNFNGNALDVQDGTVAPAGLVWKNGATVLATGPFLSLDNLLVGPNVITLQATNSKGRTATTTVTIFVDDNLNLPGPTLSVGPDKVGWQAPFGATTVQTAPLTITNTGGGDLHWTAISSQTWLHLNQAAGTVAAEGGPSLLTLSANPTGLYDGQNLSAVVTITAGGHIVHVPVTLSVGDVRLRSNVSPSFLSFFIPLVRR